jgi:RNA polymerase sigma factor (TIGR02999 family)
MPDQRPDAVMAALERVQAGDPAAQEELVGLVYDELRRVAAGLMRGERADHTLQPTALVHEAVARLIDQGALQQAANRRAFFGAAARAMRQVLVDHARQHGAQKRGGDQQRQALDEGLAFTAGPDVDVLALHEGLERLAALHERQARVVELHYFGGFTVPEVADLLGASVSLVEGDLRKARAFLRARLGQDGGP